MSAHAAWAQGLVCSNDGQPAPSALWERFINADCLACWGAAEAPQPQRAVVLDWVIPSAKGDEAPLSAVALSEAADRWQALGLAGSAAGENAAHLSRRHARHAVRVVQGVPVNGYLGATLSYRPPSNRPYTAWMLLVEQLPAGTEGAGAERYPGFFAAPRRAARTLARADLGTRRAVSPAGAGANALPCGLSWAMHHTSLGTMAELICLVYAGADKELLQQPPKQA